MVYHISVLWEELPNLVQESSKWTASTPQNTLVMVLVLSQVGFWTGQG
jgi:hypothetical protein